MKKAILFVALAMAAGAQAETADTLALGKDSVVTDQFTTSLGKSVTVTDSLGTVNVNVYQKDGTALTKLSETTFADGQEASRVYVSSPFIPDAWGYKWSRDSKFVGVHLPSLYLQGIVLTGNDELHMNGEYSYEWGLTSFNFSLSLNKRENFLLGAGLRVGYLHKRFTDNAYTFGTIDGRTTVVPIESESNVKKSYLSYWNLAIPVVMEYQPYRHGRWTGIFMGAGLELEMRTQAHARYKLANKNTITNSDINVRPFGLNLNVYAGYMGLMFYGSFGLTPLFKSDLGPSTHVVKLGIAMSL